MGKAKNERLVEEVLNAQVVSEADYVRFWERMGNVGEASELVESLAKRIIVADKKEQEARRGTKRGLFKTASALKDESTKAALVSSLYFVALFLKMDVGDKRVVAAVERLAKMVEGRKEEEVQEVCHILSHREKEKDKQEGAVSDNIVINMVYNCTRPLPPPPPPPPLAPLPLALAAPAFGLPRLSGGSLLLPAFLRLSVSRGRYADLVSRTLHGLLKLGSRMVEETQLLLILHALRSFVLSLPSKGRPDLSVFLPTLANFTAWPEPYSSMVRRTMFMLRQECRVPGQLLRTALAAALLPSDAPDLCKPNHFVVVCKVGTEFAASAFVDPDALVPTPTQLKLALLLDWVGSEVAIETNLNYEGLPPDVVDECYALYCSSTDAILSRDKSEEDAVALRSRQTRVVWKKLSQAPRVGHTRGNIANQHASVILSGQFGRISLEAGQTFHVTNLPPPTALSCVSVAFDHELCARAEVVPLGPPAHVAAHNFIHLKAAAQLQSILEEARQSGLGYAKVCVCGDNRAVHTVVCAYVYLKHSSPALFADIRLTFFVVPSPHPSASDLADFIALRDPVYRRCVHAFFRDADAFVPFSPPQSDKRQPTPLESLAPALDDEVAVTPSPQLLMKHEVQYLLWNARQVFPVQLFQCDCFGDGPNASGVLSVPFCHSVEISVQVENEAKGLARGDSRTPLDADLTIRYRQMDPQEHASRNLVEITTSLSSLVLSNVPTAAAPRADPTTPHLELVGCEPDKKARKGNRGSMLLHGATYGGPLHHHVCEAEVRVIHKVSPFHVAVDNRVFGPFHRIRVSKLKAPGNSDQPLAMPFASYFPTNL